MSATELLVWGLVAHVVADWLLQNDWMAREKIHLKHPAALVHASIHTVVLLFVFPPSVCVALGLVHAVIDTRAPRHWWAGAIGQTRDGAVALHVAFWVDQAMHLVTIAVAALLVGGRP